MGRTCSSEPSGGLRAPDAPAPLEVLERGEGEDAAVVGAQPLDRRDRLGGRAAALQPILQPQRQEAEAHAHRAALDHERPILADLARGRAGGLHGAGHVTRQREHDRGLVGLQRLAQHGRDRRHRRLGRGGQAVGALQPLVEAGRVDVDAVEERLVAEGHGDRHHPPVGGAALGRARRPRSPCTRAVLAASRRRPGSTHSTPMARAGRAWPPRCASTSTSASPAAARTHASTSEGCTPAPAPIERRDQRGAAAEQPGEAALQARAQLAGRAVDLDAA